MRRNRLLKNQAAKLNSRYWWSEPSREPSREPRCELSREPSREPSCEPSQDPSREPSSEPSRQPSRQPSREPGREPSSEPSREPNRVFSSCPSPTESLSTGFHPALGFRKGSLHRRLRVVACYRQSVGRKARLARDR